MGGKDVVENIYSAENKTKAESEMKIDAGTRRVQ